MFVISLVGFREKCVLLVASCSSPPLSSFAWIDAMSHSKDKYVWRVIYTGSIVHVKSGQSFGQNLAGNEADQGVLCMLL